MQKVNGFFVDTEWYNDWDTIIYTKSMRRHTFLQNVVVQSKLEVIADVVDITLRDNVRAAIRRLYRQAVIGEAKCLRRIKP